jgi:hypothetical protein
MIFLYKLALKVIPQESEFDFNMDSPPAFMPVERVNLYFLWTCNSIVSGKIIFTLNQIEYTLPVLYKSPVICTELSLSNYFSFSLMYMCYYIGRMYLEEEFSMALDTTQIIILHWFYSCHVKGGPASYKGSIQHFGEVLKIQDPITVIKSLLDAGLIHIDKTKLEVSITKAGIQQYESMKKKT